MLVNNLNLRTTKITADTSYRFEFQLDIYISRN